MNLHKTYPQIAQVTKFWHVKLCGDFVNGDEEAPASRWESKKYILTSTATFFSTVAKTCWK